MRRLFQIRSIHWNNDWNNKYISYIYYIYNKIFWFEWTQSSTCLTQYIGPCLLCSGSKSISLLLAPISILSVIQFIYRFSIMQHRFTFGRRCSKSFWIQSSIYFILYSVKKQYVSSIPCEERICLYCVCVCVRARMCACSYRTRRTYRMGTSISTHWWRKPYHPHIQSYSIWYFWAVTHLHPEQHYLTSMTVWEPVFQVISWFLP